MALINFSISIRNSDIIVERLFDYFSCQAIGYSANHTCYAEYDRLDSYLKPELNSATYFLLGLLPWPNLLFALQVSDIKKALRKVACFYRKDSQAKTLSTSNSK